MDAVINVANRARLSRIRKELFDMANSYAGNEHGHIACRLHGVSNSVYNIRDIMEVLYPFENTSAEDRYGKDVKPEPKPLAQYLAKYIDQELEDSVVIGQVWCELLEQALNAYESTENVRINFIKMKEKA